MNLYTKKSVIVLLILLVASSGLAYYFYSQFSAQRNISGQQTSQAEVKALIEKVGHLILLPEGEDPTIATVVDPEKLKDQPFFANSEKGDKVLIYTRTQKAILYNPGSNKIVEVAPVSIGNPPAPAASAAATPTPTTKKP